MITSTENPLIKKVLHSKRKGKKSKEIFYLAEGERFVGELLENSRNYIEKIIIKEGLERKFNHLTKRVSESKVMLVSNKVFQAIASTETTQGIAALVEKPDFALDELQKGNYLIVDKVKDPGNLGTIIRTAVASGTDGILLLKGTVDLFNDKVLRSSMGAIHSIPIVYDIKTNDLKEFILLNQLTLIISDLGGELWHNIKLPTKNYCLAVGNEAYGVCDEIKAIPGERVRLPIYGDIESLNVAIATGIMLYKLQEK
ncbi:RNA methyltransferase [Proteinivorax tanatarense]|uniref:RNA methyltransferase n=1 Tax=Proteinivorax tanatarense TaxID=1260629 RepID=A0AAU7VP77_9FIRM